MDKDDFLQLGVGDWFDFPSPSTADSDGLLGAGGNLSPRMLLSAYAQGIFPWYSAGEPILWWSLDPRFVLYPSEIRVSRSMKKIIKKGDFQLTFDRDFPSVIHHCGEIKRKGQDGTWITDEMKKAYITLHTKGFAHSVEVWREDTLAGGLYGVSLGAVFFGESMFSLEPNMSKLALIYLTGTLKELGFDMIDCQQPTAHLGTMGAREVPRELFLEQLDRSLKKQKTWKGNWGCCSHLIKAAQ